MKPLETHRYEPATKSDWLRVLVALAAYLGLMALIWVTGSKDIAILGLLMLAMLPFMIVVSALLLYFQAI